MNTPLPLPGMASRGITSALLQLAAVNLELAAVRREDESVPTAEAGRALDAEQLYLEAAALRLGARTILQELESSSVMAEGLCFGPAAAFALGAKVLMAESAIRDQQAAEEAHPRNGGTGDPLVSAGYRNDAAALRFAARVLEAAQAAPEAIWQPGKERVA